METIILADKKYNQNSAITSGSERLKYLTNRVYSERQQMLSPEVYNPFIQKKSYSFQELYTFGSIIIPVPDDLELKWMKLQENSLHDIWGGEENDHWDEFLRNA